MADLHPQLQADCRVIGRFPLCRVLLMEDATYPWFILVPDRPNISEIYHLSGEDQLQLMRESSILAKKLMTLFKGEKLNIAALGNVVPQLHIHHVVRFKDDAAWPAPVWGKAPAKPYSEEALKATIDRVTAALKGETGFSLL